MATLKQQLEDANKEIMRLINVNNDYRNTNALNRELKEKVMKLKDEVLDKDRLMHDTLIIARAFRETESEFKEVHVGDVNDIPRYEFKEIYSPIIKILDVVIKTLENAPISYDNQYNKSIIL